MKVLFVSSGNKKEGISPIIKNQGESLRAQGIDLTYFTVQGKGLKGYAMQWLPLLREIQKGRYDVIHAHYSLCGILATVASPMGIPLIVSLMGTFQKNSWKYYVVRMLARYRWKEVIVKSQRMKSQIGIERAHIVPNGVAINKFRLSKTRSQLRQELGFVDGRKVIIFVSDPGRPEKNFALCRDSVERLGRKDVELVVVHNKPHQEVVKYMLAADVLMLPSLTEGSPNVIKEAMAAGCPIVCTNVGDVDYLLKGLPGTYTMQSFTPQEGAKLLANAINFDQRTYGLQRIFELGLSENEIADKILKLYTI